jgi:hypothetical protein
MKAEAAADPFYFEDACGTDADETGFAHQAAKRVARSSR